jgi:hypothetical protein
LWSEYGVSSKLQSPVSTFKLPETVADSVAIDFKRLEAGFDSMATGARSLEVRCRRLESLYG